MEMDFSEAAKIVYNQVSKIEPEYASKIVGLLLLQDQGEDEMIRLANGPESAVVKLVNEAKAEIYRLSLKSPANDQPRYSPFAPSPPFSSPSAIRGPSAYWGSQLGDQLNPQNQGFCAGDYANNSIGVIGEGLNDKSLFLEDQLDNLSLGPDFSNSCYFPEQALLESLNFRTNRGTPTLPDYASKACHYFNKGNCWHGINCRFFHGQGMQDDYSHLMNSSLNEVGYSEQSLGKLESELIELVISRKGVPVPISSLPSLYSQKYAKNLEVEGYLCESHRLGKAGFNLIKFLARLSNLRLIDRHGQQFIMLAEDAARFLDFKSEKNDYGAIVSGSRQIYLTFPAESTFTEKDVADYFNTYGLVDDVRIPSQQKRMFGFVTFSSAETVKRILAKGNPHHVCGARVLVKPYREKSRLDRKYTEKMDSSMYYPPRFFELENTRLHSGPRLYDNARLLRKKLMEDHDRAIEFERRRLPEFHVASKPLSQQAYINCPVTVTEDAKLTDQSLLPSEHLDHLYYFNALDNGSSNEGKETFENGFDEQESSQTLNLPESPFASPITSGISTVM